MSKSTNPVKAIREKCLDCSNGSPHEVALCAVTQCPLYEWRWGKNPYREKRELTDEQKAAISARLRKGKDEKQTRGM